MLCNSHFIWEVLFFTQLAFLIFIVFLGGETSLWDLTMSNSTQGPTLEHLQKVGNLSNLQIKLPFNIF